MENMYDFTPVDFDPFADGELQQVIPIAESQLEIWLACVLGGDAGNCAYNESMSIGFKGSLNRDALVYAIQSVVARHDALRSTISKSGEEILIHHQTPIHVEDQNIATLTPADQKEWLTTFGQQEATKPFELNKGRLIRFSLIKLADHDHLLWITAHHIICDGWSFGLIIEELSAFYTSKAERSTPERIQVPVPLEKYVNELATYQKSDDFRQLMSYWKERLTPLPPLLNLPTDRPRNAHKTYQSRRYDIVVEPDIVEGIKRLGAVNGTSFVNTLLVAFEVFLNRTTNQTDIIIGLPTAGQLATGNLNLVGHCVNLLPIRSTIDPTLSFSEHLKLRKVQLLNDYDHQLVSYGSLLKSLKIKRDDPNAAFISVVFNVDIGMNTDIRFDGIEHSLTSNPRSFTNFELSLNATAIHDAFVLEWSYHTDLFEPSTIKEMAATFNELLQTISSSPNVRIDEMIMRGNTPKLAEPFPASAQEMITSPDIPYDDTVTVLDLIASQASLTPRRIAVLSENDAITYEELQKKSDQLALHLIQLGVGSGSFVSLFIERSVDTIIAILGVLKTGAAYVPIDTSYPAERISYIVTDSDAYLILTQPEIRHKIEAFVKGKAQIHCLGDLINESIPVGLQLTAPKREDIAYVIYTSGTTGKPKGVIVDHGSLANYIQKQSRMLGITNDECILQFSNYSFDASVEQVFLALTTGAKLAIPSPEILMNIDLIGKFINDKQVTHIHATPSFLELIPAKKYNHLKRIISAGERCAHKLAKNWSQHTRFINKYGPTECTISTHEYIYSTDAVPISASVPIGKALPGIIQRIVDENGEPVPIGEIGELYIGGDQISSGYLNQPDLTADRFIEISGHRMYRTGDLVKVLSDDNVEYVQRIDEQVKIRGYRIELGEIEHNLVDQNGIKDAAVVAIDDHKGDKVLAAYILQDLEDTTDWKDRWEDLYTLGVKSEENIPLEQQNLDLAIISQYYVSDQPADLGTEWTDEGLKRIKALNAKKIIELGTGGGHLLFALAPEVDQYIATDYSEVAIAKLREKISLNPGKWEHVQAYVAAADDFSQIEPNAYDLVFLHGVAQYFPTAHYLQNVIEIATLALREGGCIFIGDMQTLGAISMHFYLDQLAITSNETTIDEFIDIATLRIQDEKELSVDPDFFYNLPSVIPAIKSVDVQIRGGNRLNEATKCHYDIWLYVGSEATPEVANPGVELQWQPGADSQWLMKQLKERPDQIIAINQIPNSRLSRDFSLLQLINQSDGQMPIKELKDRMKSAPQTGFNPTDLWAIGGQLGYRTHVRWVSDGTDGCVEAVFIPLGRNAVPEKPQRTTAGSQQTTLATGHDEVKILPPPEHQIKKWKDVLQERLPEYMIPNTFSVLNKFPLTVNGKIDKTKLPLPKLAVSATSPAHHVPPSTETEKMLAKIWSDLLQIQDISITGNFFELGGHSLIAVKIMLLLEEQTGTRLPITTLFEHSTIEKLARLIDQASPQVHWESLVAIKGTGSIPPLYIVHGAGLNVMLFNSLSQYLDPDQPIYGLQARGLNGVDEPFHSIQEMAAHYISEILHHNPQGPYLLAGYSLGGIIAYEMAKQLLDTGKKVALLAVLDTFADPPNQQSTGVGKWLQRARELSIKVFYTSYMLVKDPRDTFHYKWKNMKRLAKRTYWNLTGKADEVIGVFGYLNKIDKINTEAKRRYIMQPIDIEIDVFRAKTQRFHAKDMLYLGWRDYAKNGVMVHSIDGDHNQIFKPPYSEGLGNALRKVIATKINSNDNFANRK